MRTLAAIAALSVLLSACRGQPMTSDDQNSLATATSVPTLAAVAGAGTTPAAGATAAPPATEESSDAAGLGMGRGEGRGMMAGRMDSDMRARHQAPIPEAYAGLINPIAADAESLARGEEAFTLYCVACHGESGQGDGSAAAALDPAPPPIAMTSRMMGDDYLFWRMSEGGAFAPFDSAMPAWKASVDETTRWDLVNYMRSLGGDVGPGRGRGMAAGMEQAMRAEMLAAGQAEGILTAEEAALFDTVHNQIDAQLAANPNRTLTGNMSEIQMRLLEELVASGAVSAADAAAFNEIHDRLLDAGLMQ